MLLRAIKQLILEVVKIGGQTEQGLCMFVIFAIDIATFGVTSFLTKRELLLGRPVYQSKKKQSANGKRVHSGSAVSYNVVKFIRQSYANFPVYLLWEERLINEVIKDKIISPEYGGKVNFLGLDCEWISKDGNVDEGGRAYAPVALLQISTPSECILIQMCLLRAIPNKLKNLLENRHILKFGVGIEEDCKRLRMFGIQVCGAVDLRYLIQRCYHKADIIKNPERYVFY